MYFMSKSYIKFYGLLQDQLKLKIKTRYVIRKIAAYKIGQEKVGQRPTNRSSVKTFTLALSCIVCVFQELEKKRCTAVERTCLSHRG